MKTRQNSKQQQREKTKILITIYKYQNLCRKRSDGIPGLEGTSYYRIVCMCFVSFSYTLHASSQFPPTFNLLGSLSLSRPYIKDVQLPFIVPNDTLLVSCPELLIAFQLTLSFHRPAAAAQHFFILQQFGWTCPSLKFQKFVSILPKSCLRWLAPSSSWPSSSEPVISI